MPRGGHFAAMEQPELLANAVRAFFRPLQQEVRRSENVRSRGLACYDQPAFYEVRHG